LGPGMVKQYKFSLDGNAPKQKDSAPQQKKDSNHSSNYTCYCLLKEGMVIGTDQGEILVFNEKYEYK